MQKIHFHSVGKIERLRSAGSSEAMGRITMFAKISTSSFTLMCHLSVHFSLSPIFCQEFLRKKKKSTKRLDNAFDTYFSEPYVATHWYYYLGKKLILFHDDM
jgi:hypothetical protein